MTIKAAKALLGPSVTLRKRDGEYRVCLVGGSEDSAYYTDWLDDAVLTGGAMVIEAKRNAESV